MRPSDGSSVEALNKVKTLPWLQSYKDELTHPTIALHSYSTGRPVMTPPQDKKKILQKHTVLLLPY